LTGILPKLDGAILGDLGNGRGLTVGRQREGLVRRRLLVGRWHHVQRIHVAVVVLHRALGCGLHLGMWGHCGGGFRFPMFLVHGTFWWWGATGSPATARVLGVVHRHTLGGLHLHPGDRCIAHFCWGLLYKQNLCHEENPISSQLRNSKGWNTPKAQGPIAGTHPILLSQVGVFVYLFLEPVALNFD